MKTPTVATCVLVGAAVLLIPRFPVSGQDATAKEDVLTSLLAEVRGLRQAMEQMVSAGPRIQLAMGRLQVQEQRINTLQRRLDQVRDRIEAGENDMAQGQEQAGRMEELAEQARDQAESQALSSQAEMLKTMLKRRAGELQRLRNEEAELVGLVSAEQAHWQDINQRLDELERAMTRR